LLPVVVSGGSCGVNLSSFPVLPSINISCVFLRSFVFIMVPIGLLFVSMLFSVFSGVWIVLCVIMSVVVFCTCGVPLLGGGGVWMGSFLICQGFQRVPLYFDTLLVLLAGALFFVLPRPPMWRGNTCSVDYLFVGVLGIHGSGVRHCYNHNTWGAGFRRRRVLYYRPLSRGMGCVFWACYRCAYTVGNGVSVSL
jgi:hypothetical protein